MHSVLAGSAQAAALQTSAAYQAPLAEKGVTVSMSRKGNCWDNAVTESFFGALKGKCVDLICFSTRAEAQQAIFEFIECYYNTTSNSKSSPKLSH